MQTIDELLREREARNLGYMSWARIILSMFGIMTNLAASLAQLGQLNMVLNMFLAIWTVVVVVNAVFLWLLRKNRHLALIGYTGVILDTVALWFIPEIWYQLAGGDGVPLGFFFKFPITMFCFITLAVSCLAMKPQYPAIYTAGVLLDHVYYFVIVISDPATEFSQDIFDVYFGTAVSADIFVTNMITLLLTGGTLVFFTHLARKLVFQAVSLQHETTVIQEQQSRMIMQGKMDSLQGLVAGFTHEVNTPIGVIRSGIDLVERCTQKIAEVLRTGQSLEAVKTSDPLQKSLTMLDKNTANTRMAAERISTIVSSLKNIVRLDEAEFQVVDLHEGMDSTLALMDQTFQDRIALVKEYGDLPEIGCNPTEINQVFNNILTNAAQAIEGDGTITIRTSVEEEQAVIRISDTGMGMSPEQLEQLFEPGFSKTGPRVKVGLGLFVSYHIIHNHRGDLQVESQPDTGTTVVIRLPCRLKREDVPSTGRLFE